MRHAYSLIGGGIFGIGAWYVINGLTGDDLVSGLVTAGGLAILLTGTLNLLNLTYGNTAVGLRASALGGNLALLAFVVPPSHWLEYALVVLLIGATILSFTRPALRSAPSSTRLHSDSDGALA